LKDLHSPLDALRACPELDEGANGKELEIKGEKKHSLRAWRLGAMKKKSGKLCLAQSRKERQGRRRTLRDLKWQT